MPITNFEHITEPLSDQELKLIPYLMSGFQSHDQNNPIKAKVIIEKMNDFLKRKGINAKLSEPKLRKYCNHIRSNGLLPLIATKNGYYVSRDPKEIENQIQSLQQRASSILTCANGLKKFLTT